MDRRAFAARSLRERGHTFQEIADRLGVSKTTVRRLINPEEAERWRLQSNAAKRRRTGTCVDCGSITRYNGHGIGVSDRCLTCAAAKSGTQKKVWTQERIIDAIRTWADEYGEPPAQADWCPQHARQMNDESRATRFEDDGRFPTFMTVVREFGSWNGGIENAGFTSRAPSGGNGNHRRRRSMEAA